MIVEPPEQDLLRRQSKELLKSLILLKQSVELGVQLDVNLAQQSTANNLPDQAQNQMLPDLDDVASADVHNRAADTLGGFDDNVVVLTHMESIEIFRLSAGDVEDTLIDGVRYTVVDELGENQTILALVEHLKGIGREW